MSLDRESCLKYSLYPSLAPSPCFILLHSKYHCLVYCVYLFIDPLTRISSIRAGMVPDLLSAIFLASRLPLSRYNLSK